MAGSTTHFAPYFSTDFAKNHWMKSPKLLKNIMKEPLATISEIFDTVVRVGHEEHAGRFRLFLNGGKMRVWPSILAPWLVKKEDLSFEGYSKRMAPQLNDHGFSIMINEFQQHMDQKFWDKCREFVQPVYKKSGLPRATEFELFLGNYQKTPFGVHMDDSDVFAFIISGKKRMRFWPHDSISVDPRDSYDYKKHMDKSTYIDGEPGDIIYWPESYWHVAESEGMSASINLILRYRGDPVVDVMDTLEKDLRGRLNRRVTAPYGMNSSIKKLPGEFSKITGELRKSLNHNKKLLYRTHLDKCSRYAYGKPPNELKIETLLMSDFVRGQKEYPILYKKIGKELIISACGRSTVIPFEKSAEDLIDQLNSGETVEIGGLLKIHSNTKFPKKRVLALLKTLANFHGIRLEKNS